MSKRFVLRILCSRFFKSFCVKIRSLKFLLCKISNSIKTLSSSGRNHSCLKSIEYCQKYSFFLLFFEHFYQIVIAVSDKFWWEWLLFIALYTGIKRCSAVYQFISTRRVKRKPWKRSFYVLEWWDIDVLKAQ